MMAAVFSMQGFGQLAGALIMLIVTAGFKESLLTAKTYATCTGQCGLAVDKMWRTLVGKTLNPSNTFSIMLMQPWLGFGAVPACIALYYRLTIPETPRYTFDITQDIEKASEDVQVYIKGKHEGKPDGDAQAVARKTSVALKVPKASWRDFLAFYSKWQNGKILLGTAGSWFFLDVAFYGLSLNSSTILTAIGYGTGPTVYKILFNLAAGNCILICAGAIPGYWTTVATVDTIGRKTIQLGGFIVLTILFIIWGFAYTHLSGKAMLAIYVIVQFFFNFGIFLLLYLSSILSPLLSEANSSQRSQRNDFHSSRRMLSHAVPLNLARHLRRVWKNRINHCSSRYRHPSHKRCNKNERGPMAKSCYADLCPFHASGDLYHSPDSRD
jgi:PHS family inorganic phosphate transporter-like MFS transporter